jgi:predicted Zn-dependent protease
MTRRLLALSLLLALAACVRNPITGKRQFSLVSTQEEISIGQQAAKDVQQSIGLLPNPQVQEYVARVGKELAAKSERPELPWSFQVLDDPTVNAFALPGGPIFVTRGILTHMNSEAELAAVLGHEIGHVTARHSADQITRAQVAQLGLGLGSVLSPDLAKYGELASAGLGLMLLKYGRNAETQSDELGLRYMLDARYDPREMLDLFRMLSRVQEGQEGGRLPTWLATHPNPGDRLNETQKRLAGLGGVDLSTLRTEQAPYLRLLQGVPYGENPRQGFFQGARFFHPELRFQLDFPAGWKTANQTQAVLGVSPKQDALLGLALAGNVPPEQALRQFLTQQGVQPLPVAPEGLPPQASYFQANTEQGAVQGLTAFFSHGGTTYQLLGYTAAGQLPAYDPAFRATFTSFRQLTDPAMLGVQPARLELVTLPEAMTLERFHARYPSTAPLEEVALINGVTPGDTLPAGQPVKRVVGGQLPGPR